MRRSYLAGISVLSFMAVLGTSTPAHAFLSSFFHEGPATAAVPVTTVDAAPLEPAAGVAVAPVAAPSAPVASPLAALDTQVEQDRTLALTRQNKLLQAMKTAAPTAPTAPVAPVVAAVAPVTPVAPQAEPLKKLATISVVQSGDSGEVLTPQLLQAKKTEDQNRRASAALRSRVTVPVVAQQKKPAAPAPVAVAAVRKPITPAIIHVTKATPAAALAAIAPAAGTPAPQKAPVTAPTVAAVPAVAPVVPAQAAVAAPAPAAGVDSFINRIMSYHRPDGATTAPAPMAAPVAEKGVLTLESLLASANLSGDSLTPVTGAATALKWNAGRDVSGMYEQLPVRDTLDKQIDAYLERYRRDCKAGLLSKVGKPETVAVGTLALAEVGCKDKENAYVTTFLFLQDGKNFNAVAHSAYPSARGEAFSVRDKMVTALRGAQRFAASFTPKETTSIQ